MKKFHVIIKDTETNENLLDLHTDAVFCTYDNADAEAHETQVCLHNVNALDFAMLLEHTEDAIQEEYAEHPEVKAIAKRAKLLEEIQEDNKHE